MKQRELKEFFFDQAGQFLFHIYFFRLTQGCFILTPPQKKATSLSEPKANSEERQQRLDFHWFWELAKLS